MKRISFWLLLASLLYVTITDITYYRDQNHGHQQGTLSPPSILYVNAPRGSSKDVVLPDGSAVSLNAASTLSYPYDMATGDRTVELYGEAFFDVTSNISHPFKVRAREMLVEVLGTRFNVRNYPEETYTRALVNAGAIRVCYHDSSAILHAGEEADIDPSRLDESAILLKKGVDTTAVTSWTKGLLTFSGIDLPSFLRELSRVYNVDILLQGPVVDHRFRGTLSVKEPLDDVIERLVVPYVRVSISRPEKRRLIIRVEH